MSGSSEDTWAGTSDVASAATLTSDSAGLEGSQPTVAGSGLPRGSSVGRYLILAKLGAGGMGVVHAGYDPELDRKVAIKLLLPTGGGRAGDEGRTRLLREAQALAKLDHPNVVGIHDVGTVEGRVWIAMEYVEGQTLSRWLKARPRSWREVLDVMNKVGRGVMHAHAAGLLHRDLKPDNVMVGGDGRVRVMDFGLARSHGESAEPETTQPSTEPSSKLSLELTRSGALLGTPAYMAPEQFEGRPAMPASDQFSFCVTFWEALYGQRPFGGSSIAELMTGVLAGEIQPPPREVPVPAWLHAAIVTGLARDPGKRFSSIDALLSTLAQAEGRTRARRTGVAITVVALAVVGVLAADRWDERRRTLACTAAGDRIDEVWNPESREALRAGLIATGVRYAPTVADKSMPWIDAHAEAWREASTQACMNASVLETWDAATLDKAEFCLADRRIELATLVRELSEADATVVQQAVQAAASLSPVATCIDPTSLASLPDPPEQHLREDVAEVRGDLSRVAWLRSAGKITEGLELARATRSRAEAIAWPPLSAAALELEASLLGASGAYAEAEAAGVQAYLAAERARSWDVAANAGFALVPAIARQGRNAEARVWVELATVAAEFAGDPLELREADRLHALGNLGHQSREYDEAADSHARALAIWERALGPQHPRVALGLNNLANTHARKGGYDQALEIHRRALTIREQALGPTHPDVARTLFNLGFVHDEKGEREQARALYERSLAIEEEALGPDHPELAHTLINLGNALQRQGAFAESKRFYERALVIEEASLGPDHVEVALLLDNLGIAHEELGEFEQATRLYERALAIRERAFPADDPELAASHRNLAEVQLLTGEFEQAKLSFERTLAILEKVHGADALELAKPTQRLGETLAKLGRHDEALVRLERALDLRTRLNAAPELVAESQFALARVLWDAPESQGGDPSRARTLAERARDHFQSVAGWTFERDEVEAWLAAHPATALP
jgi:tetratricopeptide (TPR) repeat protein